MGTGRVNPAANNLASLITIGVPTFNRAPYLRALLENWAPFLVQNRVRIVISDNASTDGTEEVVKEFYGRFNLLYSRNPENIGMDGNFCKVVSLCETPWVWLLGDDDIQDPQLLNRLEQVLLRRDLGCIVVNSSSNTADGTPVQDAIVPRAFTTGTYEFSDFMDGAGWYLTYVGGMIVDRNRWLSVANDRYMGSFFSHVGIVAEYMLRDGLKFYFVSETNIRYLVGNANWTDHFFRIQFEFWSRVIDLFGSNLDKSRTNEWKNAVPLRFVGVRAFVEARVSRRFTMAHWRKLVLPFALRLRASDLRGWFLASVSLLVAALPVPLFAWLLKMKNA